MPTDDDNVSNRFGPKRFLEGYAKKARLPKAYKRAPKQEKETAKRIGGFQTPASGSRFKKGDVHSSVARIECKCTSADSFRVTREMLGKIEEAGLLNDQIPYVEIEFLDGAGKVKDRVSVLTSSALTSLINRLREFEEHSATEERGERRPKRNHRGSSPFKR